MGYKLISIDSKSEWNKALAGVSHSFCHTWEHCYSTYLTTGNPTFLFCFEKDGVKIVSPLMEREFKGYKDLTKPFGFTGFAATDTHPDFADEWRIFVSEKSYVSGYLGLHPLFNVNGLFGADEIHHYNNVFILDLKPDHDEILNKMSSGRRHQLNKFEGYSASFSEDRKMLRSFFQTHYNEFLERRDAKNFYYFSSETITFLFDLNNILVVGAFESGQCVAASLFGYTSVMGIALYHASLPGAEHYSAHLVWYGALKLKSMGISSLNLGGGSKGIAKFKTYFGTDIYPLCCVKQIYRDDIYEKLCRKTGTQNLSKDTYFPAYRKPEGFN